MMIKATWCGEAVSDNRRLIQGKGRMVANPKYKAFKESMAWAIHSCNLGRMPTEKRVRVGLLVSIPPRMDVSAIIKAALDAVQLSGVIKDDNQIDRLWVARIGTEGRISTIVFEIEEIT